MIPIHLSLSGFLSYRDPVELDFTHFDLACISGPNGAGKSSLLDAITFALFGQARARDSSLINSHSQAAEVSLTFSYEGNVYRVLRISRRDKSSLLEFQIQSSENKWKALTERTLRDTDNLIQKTLRLDYETFVNASFFLQGKADQFTQQRAADRKRILGSILGLEIWEQYRQAAAEQRKTLETNMETLQGRLQEINLELGEEQQRKSRLKDLEVQLESLSQARVAQQFVLEELRGRAAAVEQQAALVTALAGQLQRAQGQLSEMSARLEARRAEQENHSAFIKRAKEIEASYANWQKLREELSRWEEIAGRFHEQELKRSEPLAAIEAERARLETELNALASEKVGLNELLATKPDFEKEYKALQAEVIKVEQQISSRPKLEAQLKESRDTQTKGHTENPMLRTEMFDLDANIKQMENAKGANCPTCGQKLTETHRLEVIAKLTKEGKKMGDRYRANQKTVKDADAQVASLEAAIIALAHAEEELRAKSVRVGQLRSTLEEMEKAEQVWKKERAPRIKEIEAQLKNETFAEKARVKLSKVDEALKITGYDVAQHDAVRKAELEARSSEADMRALEQAQAASKPLEREIKDLEKQISGQEKEVAGQEQAHSQAAAALAASQAGLPDVQSAERQMLAIQQQENQRRQEVGAAQQLVAVLDDLRSRKVDFEALREELAGRISQYVALERAFGKDGVPAMLIEQALPQIEVKANEILERLSGGEMHISFVTQQAYKDKKREDLRETLEIQISDSAGMRDYEMFSGGEAFRINFAIRLALSEVLAQRAGARLQTLVIDEGFGSQDEAGRQRLVEAINLVRADFAKILVITHIEALKDVFPTRIEVEKGPRGSTVQVI